MQFDREKILDLFKKNNIPVGAIRTMKEVFENPLSEKMILQQGNAKCVRTVAFKVSQPSDKH